MAVTRIVNPAASSNGSPSSAVWALANRFRFNLVCRPQFNAVIKQLARFFIIAAPKVIAEVALGSAPAAAWYCGAVASDSESIAVKSSPSRSAMTRPAQIGLH